MNHSLFLAGLLPAITIAGATIDTTVTTATTTTIMVAGMIATIVATIAMTGTTGVATTAAAGTEPA